MSMRRWRHLAEIGATIGKNMEKCFKAVFVHGNKSMRSLHEYGAISGKKGKTYYSRTPVRK